ncbi:hypothetical protein CGCTS75_v013272 [Colletotrichum tropicale]|nr:hypothetical protein CGCTS75_v013272 [Colletotrichum tropicale]
MSPYEDLKLISTVTTERHHRHRLSEAHSDWEARAMRSRLFSGTGAQQPDSAAEDEAYFIVASPDTPSTKDTHHDQASAATNPTLCSGTQQPESANNDDEQENGQRNDDMASPSDREGHEQRLINLAPSDCVAKAHRSALSRNTKNLPDAIGDQKTPGIVELASSSTQSDQSPPGETNTTTTTTRGLRFLEAPGTFLLAHFVSFVLLTFPAVVTGLDLVDKNPATVWQLCAFVPIYAVLATVRVRWMAYMSPYKKADSTEQKKTTMAALGDFGTAVAGKAANVAFLCAVGEYLGKLGIFLPMLNWVELFDGMGELRITEKSS